MTFSKCVALTLMTAGFAAPANAVIGTVPSAYIDSGIGFADGSSFNHLGLGVVTHSSLLEGTASSAAYATPLSRVEVSGSSGPMGTFVNADSYMTYGFVILTSQPGYADVLINANAGAGGVGSYFAFGEVDLVGQNAVLAYAHACNNVGYCSNVYSAGGTHAYSLRTNRFYGFRLHANGHTSNSFSQFTAWADPTVTFNPAYARPTGATIAFSQGFAPPAGVPEPESWALLLAGFGIVGAVVRRDRPARVAA